MLKVAEINYILRARIGNEIETIKFKDYDSMIFIAKQFEEQNIDYVIIRNDDLHNIGGLLDYQEEE